MFKTKNNQAHTKTTLAVRAVYVSNAEPQKQKKTVKNEESSQVVNFDQLMHETNLSVWTDWSM